MPGWYTRRWHEWHGCCRCEWWGHECRWCKECGCEGCQCGLRGAWGVNAGVEGMNGATCGVSMGIDRPGDVVDGARGIFHLA